MIDTKHESKHYRKTKNKSIHLGPKQPLPYYSSSYQTPQIDYIHNQAYQAYPFSNQAYSNVPYQIYPPIHPVSPLNKSQTLGLSVKKSLSPQHLNRSISPKHINHSTATVKKSNQFVSVHASYIQPRAQPLAQPQAQPLAQQYSYQTVPFETIQYQNVPVMKTENQQVPTIQKSIERFQIETQPQAQVLRESIKGESHIEYVPYEKTYIEQVPVQKIDYVPTEKRYTDYYAIERQREYVPLSRMEAVQEIVPQERIDYVPQTRVEYIPQYRTEMVPVERLEEKIDYEPYEREVIHYPHYDGQFYEEAERSGRVKTEYSRYYDGSDYGAYGISADPSRNAFYGNTQFYGNYEPHYDNEYEGYVEPHYDYEYEGYVEPQIIQGNTYGGQRFDKYENSGDRFYEEGQKYKQGFHYEPFNMNIRPSDRLGLIGNRFNSQYEYGKEEFRKY